MRTIETVVKRPLLRYFGGKWRIAPWIINHFTPHKCYVEPFGGGGSVLLLKNRSSLEVYNDLNGEIVNLFRVIRDNGEELKNKLEYTPFAKEEYINAFEYSYDPVERARRTIIKSFMGFGATGITENKPYSFTKSSHKTNKATIWANYISCFDEKIKRMIGVVIENSKAIDVIKGYDSPETLFYIDPPYLNETRKNINKKYFYEMDEDDHVLLSEHLHEVKGNVFLSGYNSGLYKKLYKDWHLVKKESLDTVSKTRIECLWIKNYNQTLF